MYDLTQNKYILKYVSYISRATICCLSNTWEEFGLIQYVVGKRKNILKIFSDCANILINIETKNYINDPFTVLTKLTGLGTCNSGEDGSEPTATSPCDDTHHLWKTTKNNCLRNPKTVNKKQMEGAGIMTLKIPNSTDSYNTGLLWAPSQGSLNLVLQKSNLSEQTNLSITFPPPLSTHTLINE